MRAISVILAIAALVTGLVAAWRWYGSSQVKIDPGWRLPGEGGGIEPTDEAGKAMSWAVATIQALNEGANLNRKAAIWTAISVACAAGSAVAGALAP